MSSGIDRWTRLFSQFSNRALRREVDDELTFHLEMRARDLEASGMDPEAARREAVHRFGNVERIREKAYRTEKARVRRVKGTLWLDEIRSDLVFGIRQLIRNPGFTAMSVLALALGIGATSAVFSVVNGVLIRPLPFQDSEGLVAVRQSAPGIGIDQMGLSPGQYFAYRGENHVFEDLGLVSRTYVNVTGLARPERVRALRVTDGTLPLLGVQPVLGRLFTAGDDTPGASPTVILGHEYWQQRFAADPEVIGQSLVVDGTLTEILAVLPERFSYLDFRPDLVVPLQLDPVQATVGGFGFQGVARLRSEVALETVDADLDRVLPLALEQFPGGATLAIVREWRLASAVVLLKEQLVGNIGERLWLLLGAIGMVLLIACANVANLILVRAERRQPEMAIRAALGAGRRPMIRLFLLEGLSLSICAGTVGLGLAWGGLRLLRSLAPENLPRISEIGLDPTVLICALLTTVLGGLILGLLPVAVYARPNLPICLRPDGNAAAGPGRRRHMRNILAVSQLALAMILLIASGLMVRSVQAIWHVDPGISRPAELLTFTLSLSPDDGADPDSGPRTYEEILRQVDRIPGVVSAGMSSSVPMDQRDYENTVDVEDRPEEVFPTRRNNFISEGYLETIGIPLLAGRSLEWADVHERRSVAVVSESFAREHWGSPTSAIGKRISQDATEGWREIVGVVADVHSVGLDREPWPTVYWPLAVASFWGSDLFMPRTVVYTVRVGKTDPTQIVGQVREAVWSVNPDLPLAAVRTLKEIMDRSAARASFTMVLLSISAVLALVLGIVGLYGVISLSVSNRTREFGLRMAIGARRGQITASVLRQGLALAATGVAIGLAGAPWLTHLMSTLLFGVGPTDATTYGAVSLILTTVALLASYVPARKAASADPMLALRDT